MVLTVEGNPTDSLITRGGYGNAKRVGHDISPTWVRRIEREREREREGERERERERERESGLLVLGKYWGNERLKSFFFQLSMVSLVDIGSNLWPFAHNSSNATVGGWWNGKHPSHAVCPLASTSTRTRSRTQIHTCERIFSRCVADLDMIEGTVWSI
jgi:hypothetical protein